MSEQLQLSYFAKRRAKLLNSVEPNSAIIIPSANEFIRNGDAHYPFRQNSSFYYLTGFNEPNSLAILLANKDKHEYILFVRPSDKNKEQWDGIRAGIDGARNTYGADRSYNINDLDANIVELLKNRSKIYYDVGSNAEYDESVISWLNSIKLMQRQGISSSDAIVNLHNIISEMRLIKDEYEQQLMLKASQISAAAHVKAMQSVQASKYEYELEAAFIYECVKHGARSQAYNPIVGSGANSCILHYNNNDQIIDKNGLVLIDAGAEYLGYASDITRTFPASGTFTIEQKAIYELVLQAQLAAIDVIKPRHTWDQAQTVIIKIITTGLVELGIIKSEGRTIDQLIQEQAYRPFYMHNSGHWLGLDVHDVGNYKKNNQWRPLEAGMVLTVEPGIYIQADMDDVDPKWWNIGVRIEDDVLVTDIGHKVLTKDVPKQIHEIETLIKGKNC